MQEEQKGKSAQNAENTLQTVPVHILLTNHHTIPISLPSPKAWELKTTKMDP